MLHLRLREHEGWRAVLAIELPCVPPPLPTQYDYEGRFLNLVTLHHELEPNRVSILAAPQVSTSRGAYGQAMKLLLGELYLPLIERFDSPFENLSRNRHFNPTFPITRRQWRHIKQQLVLGFKVNKPGT